MQFSDYTDSGELDLGSTSSGRGTPIIELSDGNYLLVDTDGTNARIRKYIKDTTTQSGSTKYVRNSGDTGNITIDLTNHVEQSLDVVVQPGQDKFIVIAPVSGSGLQVNVWNNDLTLDRTFMNNDEGTDDTIREHYGSVVSDSSGNFAIVTAAASSAPAKVFYYTTSASSSSWAVEVEMGINEWFHDISFLSNGNILLTSTSTVGESKFVILDTSGNTVSGPTSFSIGTSSYANSIRTVAYDGYFAMFWTLSNNNRYAKRYTNAGVLQTQSNYMIEDGSAGIYRDTTLASTTTNDGEVIMSALRNTDGDDYIHLSLHDPNNFQGDGLMNEDTTTVTKSSVDLHYPEVSSLGGNGGFLVSYLDSTNGKIYYRSYRSNEEIVGGGGGGDPHIVPVFGQGFDLPHDQGTYLLFDNQDLTNPVQIKAKLKQKGKSSFFGYLKIITPSQEYIIDCQTPELRLCRESTPERLTYFNLPHVSDQLYRSLKVNRVYWKKGAQRIGNTLTLEVPEADLSILITGYSRNISQVEVRTKYRIFHQARGALVRPEIIPVDF